MNANTTLKDVLISFKNGEISLENAERLLRGLNLEMVEDFARLDTGRPIRCGIPEVILAEGKEVDQLKEIVLTLVEESGRCIVTRVSPDKVMAVRKKCSRSDISCTYYERAHILVVSRIPPMEKHGGIVGIMTAGTSDIQVAEEAAVIADEMGCTVKTAYDVGAAGIHRLFPALRDLLDAHVLIVAAGREGTLPAVVAGLVDRPVIGVPVSTGYGYMGHGEAALASMLQSCAVLAVVNIDAGFTAGALAARISAMVAGHE
jgi:NCAIR mutase (PurE)-related protein